MNILTSPYLILGSYCGPASIVVLIAGLAISWRYGVLGTLAQQLLVVLIFVGVYIINPEIKGSIDVRIESGTFIEHCIYSMYLKLHVYYIYGKYSITFIANCIYHVLKNVKHLLKTV